MPHPFLCIVPARQEQPVEKQSSVRLHHKPNNFERLKAPQTERHAGRIGTPLRSMDALHRSPKRTLAISEFLYRPKRATTHVHHPQLCHPLIRTSPIIPLFPFPNGWPRPATGRAGNTSGRYLVCSCFLLIPGNEWVRKGDDCTTDIQGREARGKRGGRKPGRCGIRVGLLLASKKAAQQESGGSSSRNSSRRPPQQEANEDGCGIPVAGGGMSVVWLPWSLALSLVEAICSVITTYV